MRTLLLTLALVLCCGSARASNDLSLYEQQSIRIRIATIGGMIFLAHQQVRQAFNRMSLFRHRDFPDGAFMRTIEYFGYNAWRASHAATSTLGGVLYDIHGDFRRREQECAHIVESIENARDQLPNEDLEETLRLMTRGALTYALSQYYAIHDSIERSVIANPVTFSRAQAQDAFATLLTAIRGTVLAPGLEVFLLLDHYEMVAIIAPPTDKALVTLYQTHQGERHIALTTALSGVSLPAALTSIIAWYLGWTNAEVGLRLLRQ